MITLLGAYSEAGGKLKESGTVNWKSPNIGATNLSGFTALPGGYRSRNGVYTFIIGYAYCWNNSISTGGNYNQAFWINNKYSDNGSTQ